MAGDCADRFQRSSSGVEGRNGQLALRHHGRHRLSDRKLAAFTAVRNYHIRRADGTTAAERFLANRIPYSACELQQYYIRAFQACSNRIPYSASPAPCGADDDVSSLFKQDSLFRLSASSSSISLRFKPVQTGFPIQVNHIRNSVIGFQACSNRIPYSGNMDVFLHLVRFKPVQTGFPIQETKLSNAVRSLFQACSNRIPYSGLYDWGDQRIVSSLFKQDSLFRSNFSQVRS